MAGKTTPTPAATAPATAGTPAASDPWARKPAAITDAPKTAPKGTGGTSRTPLRDALANPVGYMLRNRASGSQGTGGLASITEDHVLLMAQGGTVRDADGTEHAIPALPLPLISFALGHHARNEPTARGTALMMGAAYWAAGRLAVASEGGKLRPATDDLHPITGAAKHTVRACRLMATAPVPQGFTPAAAISAARGAAALYGRVQDRA